MYINLHQNRVSIDQSKPCTQSYLQKNRKLHNSATYNSNFKTKLLSDMHHRITCLHTNSLQRLQNMAARIICRCGPRDHVTPLRIELHWLPIEARPVFKILCYTYKAIHGNLPDYMCDLVSVYNPKRCGLRSGNSSIKRLCTVKANSAKYGYMCYSLAAPALWNPLPENIRSAETFVTFKKSLKTFLFKKYLC